MAGSSRPGATGWPNSMTPVRTRNRSHRAAGKDFENGELRGATLYSTLQPCGMCTMASIWSKVSRIVFGAGREDVHKMYFEARAIDTLEFVTKAYRDDLTISGGILKEECAGLYYRPWDKVPVEEQGNL